MYVYHCPAALRLKWSKLFLHVAMLLWKMMGLLHSTQPNRWLVGSSVRGNLQDVK